MTSLKQSAERASALASEKLHDAGEAVRGTAAAVRASANQAYDKASEKMTDTLSTAKQKSVATIDKAKDKASAAYGDARARTSTASRKAAEGIDANPVAAIVGGIALGAIAAALLPRTEREGALLGPIGARINDAAKLAATAARAAGKDKLDELGLSRDNAREQIGKLFDGALKAAGSASDAAAETVRAKKA